MFFDGNLPPSYIILSGAVFGRYKSSQRGKRPVPAATTFCEQVQNMTLVHAVSASGLILDQCSFSVTVEKKTAPHS